MRSAPRTMANVLNGCRRGCFGAGPRRLVQHSREQRSMPGPRMTVCQVLFSLKVAGAEMLAARIARRLSDSYRFVFACLEEKGPLGEQLRDEGFTVHVLDKRPGVDPRAAKRLRSLINEECVDLVHAHQYGPFFYATMARLPQKRPSVLLTEHGRSHPDYPRRGHFLANRLLLGKHDRLVAVGQSVRKALIDNEGFPPGRVEVVYNGIDEDRFSAAVPDRDEVRREMGVGQGDLVIVQVARLDPIKDHVTAIRAIARVANRRSDIQLVLVGDGPESEAIEALIRELGVEGQIRCLGRRDDIARLLGAADFMLLTSHSEGIPLTLIEGMAAGLPVVATRVGGVPEVVEEGRTGLLAPAGDEGALADQILQMAADRGLQERMGRAGRERARLMFTEDRMITTYEAIYREMIKRMRGGQQAQSVVMQGS